MQPEVSKYLADMAEAVAQIGAFCNGRSEADLAVDGYQVIRDAVTWQIITEKLPVLRAELNRISSGG